MIDREQLSRSKARGEQAKAYLFEHEAEWLEMTEELSKAAQAYVDFGVEGGLTVNEAIAQLLRHVFLVFSPPE